MNGSLFIRDRVLLTLPYLVKYIEIINKFLTELALHYISLLLKKLVLQIGIVAKLDVKI